MPEAAHSADLARLNLLASALAGRDLGVACAEPGTPAWTDGNTVFLDASADRRMQLQQLAVQCGLLAAGSLDGSILRRLVRRPELARRYLAVEGRRAVAALGPMLPASIRPPLDLALASRPDSPAASLAIALGRERIEEAPGVFGTIRLRELRTAQQRAAAAGGEHLPRRQQRELRELPDEPGEESVTDAATSPVGGGGGLGRLLQKMLQAVRQIGDGGPPGAEAATHWSAARPRSAVRSPVTAPQAETVADAFGAGRGILYPEWDAQRRSYRPDWCTVQELEPPADHPGAVEWLEGHGLRRPLARLGLGLERLRRQAQGDDIDIDAAIEAQLQRLSGGAPEENSYIESRRRRRDLSVLVLLDISGSTAQASSAGGIVHEQQRRIAATLTTVLYEIGDRVALYAFHSQGRAAVHLVPLKRFDQALDSRVMRRLHSLVPGAYSRLGAAIRHGSSLLLQRGGTARRLLLVLSDGLAYDHGYEPAYGAADARQALAEARRDGVGCLCLSVGADTDSAALKKVFGSAAHAAIPRADQAGGSIGPLIRAALRHAETARRLARTPTMRTA